MQPFFMLTIKWWVVLPNDNVGVAFDSFYKNFWPTKAFYLNDLL
jgi:hypothetical protein